MLIDNCEYEEILNEFLLQMEKLSDCTDHDVEHILEKVCRILGVSKVQVNFYQTEEAETSAQGETKVFYSVCGSEIDEQRFFELREITGAGTVAVYRLFQYQGDEDWDQKTKQRIHVFVKMLFTFHGRSRVMKLADRLTFYDKELQIHNLTYFFKEVGKLFSQGKLRGYTSAYFNLKRFSIINQTYGRPKGTVIMKKYVDGLQGILEADEYVCRIGGDNFICLFHNEHTDKVVQYLKGAPVTVQNPGEAVNVSAYAGFYKITGELHEITEIMDCASIAFHVAKEIYRTSTVFFNEEMKKTVENQKTIEDIFPSAISREEFLVYYQPKICLNDYRLAGAEALCRWFHDGELVSPAQFIPVLERGNTICTLDFYMLEHVCMDIQRWLDEGRTIVKISINLSRRHLGDPELLPKILGIIDKYQVPHEYIEIELTETTTDVDFKELKEIVGGLRDNGISTSVDDFGMGYSSINLIRELPWNVLKVDKSFLPEHGNAGGKQYAMLKHLIAMAQDMGLECIVEGVETREHVKLLKENNCFLAQGFYFDKPLPVEEFENRLDELLL